MIGDYKYIGAILNCTRYETCVYIIIWKLEMFETRSTINKVLDDNFQWIKL